jgi:hypothetical protein
VECSLYHLRLVFARWANKPQLAKAHAVSVAKDPSKTPDEYAAGAGPTTDEEDDEVYGDVIASERTTNPVNMCYLYTALLAIDYVRSVSVQRTMRQLRSIQRVLLKLPANTQDDASIAIMEVVKKKGLNVRIWDQMMGGPVPEPPYIAVNQRIDIAQARLALAPGTRATAWITYVGNGDSGHYTFICAPQQAPASARVAVTVVTAIEPDGAQPPPTPLAVVPAPSTQTLRATARALGHSTAQLETIEQRGEAARAARQQARAQQTAAPQKQKKSNNDGIQRNAPQEASMSRREVQDIVRHWKEGDAVYVHWARLADEQDPSTEHVGRWAGRVKKAGRSPVIEFTVQTCEHCSDCRDMSPIEVPIPLARTRYMTVEKRPLPRTRGCECVEVDDDEDLVDATMPSPPGTIEHEDRLVLGSHEGAAPTGVVAPQTNATWRPAASSLACTSLRGDAGSRWHIFPDKAPGMHNLVWSSYAPTTRAEHRRWIQRVRGMPSDLCTWPFGRAIVELVRRFGVQRKWVWSTMSSALATLATALKNLPIYTSEMKGINLKEDVYFADALKTAQRMAKTTVGSTDISAGMPEALYHHLISSAGIKAPDARLLLMLSWHFAARVGDMRQARARDIVVCDPRPDGRVPMKVTFRYGKVASLWGPYTIHCVVPKDVSSAFTAFAATKTNKEQGGELFTKRDQAVLSAHIATCQQDPRGGRLTLRSIRRGALLRAAACGVTDDELQLLSGHKRRETLMRYLGWGQQSSTMSKAAERRADKMKAVAPVAPVGAGDDYIPREHQAPVMGRFSGYTGFKGQRVKPKPEFFPRKPPSARDCGVTVSEAELATYTLHIKETTRVIWDQVEAMAADSPLANETAVARRWCSSDQLYGPKYGRDPRHVPAASFTPEQIQRLLDAQKIAPFRGEVKGFVKAFTLAQHAKKRLRIIAEPIINETCMKDEMYKVHYPARLERRARALGAKYSVELDFAAFFDQFDLAQEVLPWFVLRSKEPVDGQEMFALTRMPMGATFAPSVAQTVTSVIVWPAVLMNGVRIDTMIDNIRIVADTKEAFVKAVRVIGERIKRAGITLNDAHVIEGTDEEIADRHLVTDAPRIFLGEKYVRDTVANSDAAVEKLIKAKEVYDNAGRLGAPTYTKRHFASIVGLMLFMAHTVNVPLTKCFDLLRCYGRIISQSSSWDDQCGTLSPCARATFEWLASTLIANKSVPITELNPPGKRISEYGIAIEVDASGSAWGARVYFTDSGRMVTLQQKWPARISHSAHAEPRAAEAAVRWARSQPGCANARVALITDHVALVTGQRRWHSNFSGFSTSYYLNHFYDTLYANGGGEVFHVDGERNEADQLSRDPNASYTLTVREASTTFRELDSVTHPFEKLPRAAYQV